MTTDLPATGRRQLERLSNPNPGPDRTAIAKARLSTGFVVMDGKHVASDGLVARSGRRRVLPDSGDDDWLDEMRAEQLAAIASQTLRGRNAAVFEGRVIAPLLGGKHCQRSVESLAAQFGVTPAKIHKITERCKLRIAEMVASNKAIPLADSTVAPPRRDRIVEHELPLPISPRHPLPAEYRDIVEGGNIRGVRTVLTFTAGGKKYRV